MASWAVSVRGGFTAETRQRGWSVTKPVANLYFGTLVAEELGLTWAVRESDATGTPMCGTSL